MGEKNIFGFEMRGGGFGINFVWNIHPWTWNRNLTQNFDIKLDSVESQEARTSTGLNTFTKCFDDQFSGIAYKLDSWEHSSPAYKDRMMKFPKLKMSYFVTTYTVPPFLETEVTEIEKNLYPRPYGSTSRGAFASILYVFRLKYNPNYFSSFYTLTPLFAYSVSIFVNWLAPWNEVNSPHCVQIYRTQDKGSTALTQHVSSKLSTRSC